MPGKTSGAPQVKELDQIYAYLATAALQAQDQWLALEAPLPLIRQVCPEFYESWVELLRAAFQNYQTLEGAGDDMRQVIIAAMQPKAQIQAPPTAPLIGMQ